MLTTVIEAALLAGKEILKVYNTDFAVEHKTDESPLTLADREAHRVIVEHLQPLGIPILSEEGKEIPFEERKNWNQLFIVDPLDGTKEFVKRNGEFTVNIALVKNGKPVLGVIYVPVQDTMYFAQEEYGAFMMPEAAKCPLPVKSWIGCTARELPLQPLPETVTVVGSRSHASPETDAYIKELETKFGEVAFAASGSSLKFCLLAEGRAQLYPRFAPTMEWDTAAGQAILECSGGKVVLYPELDPLSYNREELRNPWFLATAKL